MRARHEAQAGISRDGLYAMPEEWGGRWWVGGWVGGGRATYRWDGNLGNVRSQSHARASRRRDELRFASLLRWSRMNTRRRATFPEVSVSVIQRADWYASGQIRTNRGIGIDKSSFELRLVALIFFTHAALAGQINDLAQMICDAITVSLLTFAACLRFSKASVTLKLLVSRDRAISDVRAAERWCRTMIHVVRSSPFRFAFPRLCSIRFISRRATRLDSRLDGNIIV